MGQEPLWDPDDSAEDPGQQGNASSEVGGYIGDTPEVGERSEGVRGDAAGFEASSFGSASDGGPRRAGGQARSATPADGRTDNTVVGDAHNVVQVGTVHGGIHIHSTDRQGGRAGA